MNSQKQILKVELAKSINDFYVYCGYEITKKQMVELSKLIFESWINLTEAEFNDFINTAKRGELGMIYKSPVSFMVAFAQYKKDNGKITIHQTTLKADQI